MHRAETVEAIILKTYDVGEADRYCVFFTRERGRLAARASGVRKPKSRMGGSMLAFRHAMVEIKESAAGWIVTSVRPKPEAALATLASFAAMAEGAEILLRLTQDDEPLPSVFDATVAFFRACRENIPFASLAYTLRLLHVLGFLPGSEEMESFFTLTPEESLFLESAREGYFLRTPGITDAARLEGLKDHFLKDQLSGPLKVPGVVATFQ